MIYTSSRTRYYFALALLLLLGVLLRLSAQAAPGPEEAVSQRALAYTRYLTQALQLQPHQFVPVRRCTEQQLTSLDSLATQPATPPAAYARTEAYYLTDLQLILTPGQYAALVALRERQPLLPATHSPISSR
jgi:hypothetical protein